MPPSILHISPYTPSPPPPFPPFTNTDVMDSIFYYYMGAGNFDTCITEV